MQNFVLGILVKLIADPKVQEFLLQVVDRLAKALLPSLAAVIPAAVGAGISSLGKLLPHIDFPGVEEVTEDIRKGINAALPEDIDIPILSDAFEKLTGIDLTDILTGKHHSG